MNELTYIWRGLGHTEEIEPYIEALDDDPTEVARVLREELARRSQA